MRLKNVFTVMFMSVSLALSLTCCNTDVVTADYNVIPLPQEISACNGSDFLLDSSTSIYYSAKDTSLRRDAELLSEYIEDLTGNRLKIVNDLPDSGFIELSLGTENSNPEAYSLKIDKNKISICGTTPSGLFYGIQTLRKSIPPSSKKQNVKFSPVEITDFPRFSYRGAHLDVSRHIFPLDSIKSFIDMLALHNINRFHWHISDDQGWRIEIKKLPRLTEIGSMRNGTCIGHDMGTSDSILYGGFFTQDEAREIVKYAAERHITVIPEIDMPGHMLGALKAYPELGCTGGPYEVWQRWGVSEDVLCAGNDSVLTFIDDVLGEIVDIFPSEYIHVGGDECPKIRWKECPKCQAKAKELGLKDNEHWTVEEQLQSYIIHHASDFLTSRGRKMIGWDETLEGGLAPGAIVMSWRDENGAKEAARQGHDAVMTPTSHMYFDYCQTLDRGGDEPDAAGGYIPVERVYSFNPVPEDLSEEEKKHIIGVQANLWTEYISSYSGVEYAELPRMAALSEVQWSAPDKRDYQSFVKRLPGMLAHYRKNGYRYATHIYNVSGKLTPNSKNKNVEVTLFTVDDAPIYYTLDGNDPTETSAKYSAPFAVDKSCKIKAVAIRPDIKSKIYTDSVTFNKATCHDIVLKEQPHAKYSGNGASTLLDGKYGSEIFSDGNWLGFQSDDLEATIDLGKDTYINSVALRFYVEPGSWIYDTPKIEVYVSSDGNSFRPIATEEYPIDRNFLKEIRTHELKFPIQKARYIRIKAESLKEIPEWHTLAAGNPAFIFIDEILID